MATAAKIKNRLEETVAELKQSREISLTDKDDYIELLTEAADGTNGLTLEEKVQANANNTFNLCYLMIRDKLEGGGGRSGLYMLIFRCRWQIVILAGFITLLLAFRPQLAAIIEAALIH